MARERETRVRTTRYKPNNPNNHSVKYLNRMARYSNGNLWIARDSISAMVRDTFQHREEFRSPYTEETKYELINKEKVYWSEFFIFWDNDTNQAHIGLEYAKPYIIDALYQNSGVGVVMVNDSALVYRLAMFWRNSFYEVTRANGIIYAYPTDYDASLPNYSLMNRFDLTNLNCALEISSKDAKPWGYGIEAWATRRAERYISLDINNINSRNMKVITAQSISDNARREIDMMNAGTKPWHVIDGRIDQTYNMGLENIASMIWVDYWNLIKDYHLMRGIRYNFDAKSERNISAEVGKNDASFIVLENEKYRILLDLVAKINKLFKKNITVKKVIDIYDTEKAKIDAIPQMLAQFARGQAEVAKQEVANDGKKEVAEVQGENRQSAINNKKVG